MKVEKQRNKLYLIIIVKKAKCILNAPPPTKKNKKSQISHHCLGKGRELKAAGTFEDKGASGSEYRRIVFNSGKKKKKKY